MSSAGQPALDRDRRQREARHLRSLRRLAAVPWPCLWLAANFLCRSAWGRRLVLERFPLLGRQLEFSRRLFAALELPPDRAERELTQLYLNKFFQTVLLARLASLSPRQEARQFEVSGWEHLEAERAAGRPFIMGGSHFGVNRVFCLWLARRGVEVLSLAHGDQLQKLGVTKPPALRVIEIGAGFTPEIALTVMRHLRCGGCLQVTGDWPNQKDGPHSYERTFRGITRKYPQGMANFALTGGAAILPYSCTLRPWGKVRIEIHPPLRPPSPAAPAGSAAREEQLAGLVDRFAGVLEAEIERSPGTQRWM
ncbi:MAG: hypothetical protein ACKO5R_07995 [Planctomycetaceae bacterium]